jgi:hypothetical protein
VREFPVQYLDGLLLSHGITASGSWQRSSNRFWRSVGQLNQQPVFLKAASRPALRVKLRREIAIAREVRAADIPTTLPLLAIDPGDWVIAVFQFEPRAEWQSGNEVNATGLGQAHAVAVAETLARLSQLRPEQVPSVPRHRRPAGPSSDLFVAWANNALDVSPYGSSSAVRRSSLREHLEQVHRLPVSATIQQLAGELAAQSGGNNHLFVHGDACPANTAFMGDNVAAFFDFEWSRVEVDRHLWLGIDIMNYVTRSWANLEFATHLIAAFTRDVDVGQRENLALRAALVLQTLNKLGPAYAYPEPKWQATQARFETLVRMLSYALEHRDNFAAMPAA